MKNTRLFVITIAFVLVSFPVILNAGSWNGWIYQDPYPTSVNLFDVKFVTPQKGWITGKYGTMLYTEDGGENWEAQENGTEEDLKRVCFANEKMGWAAGERGTIIHTDDGGKKWTTQFNIKASPTKIFFINEKEGWVTGSSPMGVVYHTTDSGKTWRKVETGITRAIASVCFINSKFGWILAGEEVYRTTDGGKKWKKSQLPVKMKRTGNLPGGGRFMSMMGERLDEDWSEGEIFFVDDQSGWAVVGKWFIFHTEDGGKTWTDQLMSPMSYSLKHIFFTNSKNGCATGSSIICTEDGKTWSERLGVRPRDTKVIDGFAINPQGIFFSGLTGWTVGNDGLIMKTEDSGKKWKVMSRKNRCGSWPFFINEEIGWLSFRFPTVQHICKTEDGGHTWTRQEVGIGLINIFFVDALTGWAIGEEDSKKPGQGPIIIKRSAGQKYMVIKHTINGGKTWTTQLRVSAATMTIP